MLLACFCEYFVNQALKLWCYQSTWYIHNNMRRNKIKENDKDLKIYTYCAFINSKLACSMLSRKNWTSTNKMKIKEIVQISHINYYIWWYRYSCWVIKEALPVLRSVSILASSAWKENNVRWYILQYIVSNWGKNRINVRTNGWYFHLNYLKLSTLLICLLLPV